ncbi:MAG: hypothetical protein JNJ57_14560 [Saprospiraceae bacterium]|nr:hypothetical protein [Saprospiraceae bacterium]
MKNRILLLALFLASNTLLFAQFDPPIVEMYGTQTCDCEGCFIGTVYNGVAPYSLQWSNGLITNLQQGSNSFTECGFCPGTYTVTVTSANGITATATGQISFGQFTPVEIVALDPPPCNNDSLNQPPSSTCLMVCAGSTITFGLSNSSPGTSGILNWSVAGATSWTVQQPFGQTVSVTWGAAGSGSVTVSSDDPFNCIGQDFLCVTILEPPSADIGTTPAAPPGNMLQICKGQTVDFQNLSTGDADHIEWFFSDDLSNTTLENPQHTFLNPGIHTITLVAKSDCICSDTTSIQIEVLDAVAPTLDCVSTVCPGATVTYTTSNACAPFSWTVSANGTVLEGGTSVSDSITIEWASGPLGVITLQAPACSGATCPVGGSISIPILSDNAEIRGKDKVCPQTTETYSIEPFGGAGFQWSISGGGIITEGQGTNNITVSWTAPPSTTATHWLSVVYDNCYLGCSGRDSISVKILPAFYIAGPVEACEMGSANFATRLVSNNAPTQSNWTIDGPGGGQVWASGASTVTINPTFNNGPGYYRVFAEPANTGQVCNDRADWGVDIIAPPSKLTNIKGITVICPGIPYTYEAEGGNAASNYQWTIKNGASLTTQNGPRTFNVTWNASGPYWVSVAHVSNDGLSCKSDTIKLDISPITLPQITGNPLVCEDDKGIYTIAPLEKVDMQWQINPPTAGSVADGQGTNAAEIFWSEAGGHVVNLNVCGLTAVFPVTVPARPAPVVLAPAGLCPGATATVQTATAFSGYAWKDGSGVTISTVAAPILGPGSYAVEVTDPNGCTGVTEFFIDSWDTPDVSLTTPDPTGFCNNSSTVHLSALINADADYTFQWFQDGNILPGVTNTTYSTNQYGNYTVQATNAKGCTSVAGPIRVFEYCLGGSGVCSVCSGNPICPPGSIQAVIDPTPRCDSFVVVLNDYSGLYVPGSAQWVAGVSGGNIIGTSNDESPSFVFPNAGRYIVAVKVLLSNGEVCETLDSLRVEAVAQFKVLPSCPGDLSEFEDVSEFLPGYPIAGYAWNFGDPASGIDNTSVLANPDHTFATSGIYDAMLTVTGPSGCTSTATAPAVVPDLPNVAFTEPAKRCAGNALEFNPPPNAVDITEISWDFGDPVSGASNDAKGSPVYHNFVAAGNYMVTLTAKNVYGCTASFSKSVVVAPNNMTGTISPPNATICEGQVIGLLGPANGGVSPQYVWSDPAATTGPLLIVGEEGSYRVTLTDANGCTYAPPAVRVELNLAPDALIKALEFNELNQVIDVSYPTTAVCFGEDVVLQAVTIGNNYNYNWSGGNGFTQSIYFTEERNTLLPVGNYSYQVTVTNTTTGCTMVTTPFQVQVNPIPTGFWITSNGSCAGTNTTLTYNGPQPPNWQLFWNTGQSGSALTTDEPGTYFVRVVNEFGCEARSNPYTIFPGPPVGNIPSGCFTRCKPDTLCLPNLPTVIAWQWFYNGSPIPGATTSNFIAQQSGTYYAELTDYYGCTAQSDPLTLNLFDGYGNVLGRVWSDVNNNGIIDAADTLMSGIPVELLQNGNPFGTAVSGSNGSFAWANVLSTNYLVQLDQNNLPPFWHVVIGSAPVTLSGCDVQGSADLLLHFQCTVASSNLELFACPGAAATYNGTPVMAGTTQSFFIPLAGGCDSTVTVTVTPLATSTGSETLYACPGGFATYNGANVPVNTSQNFTFQNAAGCDSVVTVTVQSLTTSTGTATLFACPGGSANYQGTSIPVGSTQNFTLQNVAGCDSVVTVTVQAWPTSNTATLLFGCAGGFVNYNGTNIPVGSSQQFTFQNWVGCDSIVTVNTLALQSSTGAATLFACPGGSASYQGTSIPVGSSQAFTLQNWLGCDSVVTVNVQPWPTSTGAATLFTCPGTLATYQGVNLPIGASQAFTLQNWLGCDSIVTVQVQALATSASAFEVGVCPNETFNYQGQNLSGGTVQQFTLPNWLGCDSVVTVTVKQLHSSTNSMEVSVCPGLEYDYNGTKIPAGQSRDFHLSNAEGCDSTLTVVVLEFPSSNFSVKAEQSCKNQGTGSLEVSVSSGGQAPYSFSIDQVNYQSEQLFDLLNAGGYTVYLEDGNNCIFQQNVEIPAIPEILVTLPNGVLPCDSAGIELRPVVEGGDAATMKYRWWNGAETAATQVLEAGPVWVEVSDQCSTERSEAQVQWADLAPDLQIVYVPNVMKPTAVNPENAEFKPIFAAGITVVAMHFEVFDRWGNKLFETESLSDAWNGNFRADQMNPGVQVWHLEADISICGRIMHIFKKGDVTVVR